MRLTVLMGNTPFVVPVIKPAMPITLGAIQRRVGTLRHPAILHAQRNMRPRDARGTYGSVPTG
jgi:hypothetical protein